MDTQTTTFAQLLLNHRHRLDRSQQEVATTAGIHASDLSKMERGERKPPRQDVLLRLIDGLQLSHTDARELVRAAGYSSKNILKGAKYDPSEYPPVEAETIAERLQGEYGRWPIAELDTERKIVAANLLAFRLWGALKETDRDIKPNRLLGEYTYTVLVRPENVSRISMPAKQTDFWYTFLAVWNKLREDVPIITINAVEEAIKAHPLLKLILRYGEPIEREWTYTMDILPPEGELTEEKSEMYLKFQIEVKRIIDKRNEHTGYMLSFQPIKVFTQNWVEREYARLIDTHGAAEFVQRELDTDLTEQEERYPPFFPAVHYDKLWIINFENRSFTSLFDEHEEYLNKPYLEMLLSPQTIARIGGFDKQKLAIPVRLFFQQTKEYDQDEQYAHIKARLLELPAFRTLLTKLWSTPSEDHSRSTKGVPYFSVQVECPFTNTLKLSLDVISRRLYMSEVRITFVPTTNETKLALILLRLQNNEGVLSLIGKTEHDQLLWLLAILKTTRVGLTKKEGKTDWDWHPERAFKKFHSSLIEQETLTSSEAVEFQIKWEFAQLLFDNESKQDESFAILIGFMEKLREQAPCAYEFLLKVRAPTDDIIDLQE